MSLLALLMRYVWLGRQQDSEKNKPIRMFKQVPLDLSSFLGRKGPPPEATAWYNTRKKTVLFREGQGSSPRVCLWEPASSSLALSADAEKLPLMICTCVQKPLRTNKEGEEVSHW